jgi:membrane protein DedA with SNARE-associated domain
LLNHEHLEWTERWFSRHGSWTIFVSRFIPVVRHLISIPAGIGKMSLAPFCIYTIVGATIWNTFLLLCGYYLRQNWRSVQKYSHELDILMVVVLVVAGIAFLVMQLKRRANSRTTIPEELPHPDDQQRVALKAGRPR